MAKKLHKYMNVDVVAFLEEQMKSNTEHYQTDFEYDRAKLEKCGASDRKEDKVLLWLSRPHGTQCLLEYEAFLRGTEAYHTWQYYADQEPRERYVAFAVELMGGQDGVVRGNLYELDYSKHAAQVKRESQPAYDVVKTFEDGFVAQVAFERSSYGYWSGLVEEHGAIVESRAIPSDSELLQLTLAEERRERERLKAAVWEPRKIDDVLKEASQRSSEGVRDQEPGDRECIDK